jgi:hypothetical protein
MDVETPAGGRDKDRGFAPEKRRTFHRGTLAEPYLGGMSPLHRNVGLGRPRTSPRRFMMSSLLHGRFGETDRAVWHVWQVGEAQGGLTFCSRRLHLP